MSAQVAVVTGGASGLGAATAARLRREGWHVVVLDRDADALARAVDADDGLEVIACDVLDESSILAAFDTIAARHPRLDALVCSAGVLRVGRLDQMSTADFDLVFGVNLRGSWLAAKAAMPLLSASADRPGGRIVFFASIAALRHRVNSGAYAASKTAVAALTRVMAVEAAQLDVRVNAVAPGTVDTPMTHDHFAPREGASYRANGPAPLGRHTTTADVAGVVAFLLGPDADYVSGAVIPIDGATSAALSDS